jgi:hypothetical protein
LNSYEYGIRFSMRLCRGFLILRVPLQNLYLLRQDEQNAKAGKGDEVLVEEVRSLKKRLFRSCKAEIGADAG